DYIKLFISSKKKSSKKKQEKKEAKDIFTEPIEQIFDNPEIIKTNFDEYLEYSENYYNNLVKNDITIDFDYISKFTDNIVNIDKNNEFEYNRYLFLLEYLSLFIK
ncbi:MAG: hypothetical protein U0354_20890, partial [Candidatus Sericytochromatia bacterium]